MMNEDLGITLPLSSEVADQLRNNYQTLQSLPKTTVTPSCTAANKDSRQPKLSFLRRRKQGGQDDSCSSSSSSNDEDSDDVEWKTSNKQVLLTGDPLDDWNEVLPGVVVAAATSSTTTAAAVAVSDEGPLIESTMMMNTTPDSVQSEDEEEVSILHPKTKNFINNIDHIDHNDHNDHNDHDDDDDDDDDVSLSPPPTMPVVLADV